MTKRNPQEPAATGHRARGFEREAGAASPGLERIRQAAGRNRSERFTALLHHVTVAMLRDAFRALKRTACPGVDDVTWRQYEKDQEGHLLDLHARVQRGTYRAQPSKRMYLPKPDGRQRPIGIAAIEDKIVQKAVAMVLERIWEEDFAVPGAGPVLNVFRSQVCRLWKRALQRRSQKGDRLTWERMKRWIAAWIPSVRILHEYPNQRLTVNTLKVRAV